MTPACGCVFGSASCGRDNAFGKYHSLDIFIISLSAIFQGIVPFAPMTSHFTFNTDVGFQLGGGSNLISSAIFNQSATVILCPFLRAFIALRASGESLLR